MTLRKVTLEVTDTELFDAIHKVGDGGEALGHRIVGVLLAGRNWREEMGMGMYGVKIVGIEET